ncbi:hypothetical protein FNF29_03412 [Cafeteria roenbergensis]|uniref:Uncharacterized protein n=1 Tax=Cafeteria roenbergensis TaxID=33653 RepID=A0A5A8CL32_CAFRO|nr:hypothetical protein FNF29_03412 [Cafeteria roenbergensis]|eukprot:KAA0153224.1 hypothetical protein FNF29_03412 [Cafeteria roenbergensis]
MLRLLRDPAPAPGVPRMRPPELRSLAGLWAALAGNQTGTSQPVVAAGLEALASSRRADFARAWEEARGSAAAIRRRARLVLTQLSHAHPQLLQRAALDGVHRAWETQARLTAPAMARFADAAAAAASATASLPAIAAQAASAKPAERDALGRALHAALTSGSADLARLATGGRLAAEPRDATASGAAAASVSQRLVVGAQPSAQPLHPPEAWQPARPQPGAAAPRLVTLQPVEPALVCSPPNSILAQLWALHRAVDATGAELQRVAIVHRLVQLAASDLGGAVGGRASPTRARRAGEPHAGGSDRLGSGAQEGTAPLARRRWAPSSLRRMVSVALCSLELATDAEALCAAHTAAMLLLRRGARATQSLRRALEQALAVPGALSTGECAWGAELEASLAARPAAAADSDSGDETDLVIGHSSASSSSSRGGGSGAAASSRTGRQGAAVAAAVSRLQAACSEAFGLVCAAGIRAHTCAVYGLSAQRCLEFKPRAPLAADKARAAVRSDREPPLLVPPAADWLELSRDPGQPVPLEGVQRLHRLLRLAVQAEQDGSAFAARRPVHGRRAAGGARSSRSAGRSQPKKAVDKAASSNELSEIEEEDDPDLSSEDDEGGADADRDSSSDDDDDDDNADDDDDDDDDACDREDGGGADGATGSGERDTAAHASRRGRKAAASSPSALPPAAGEPCRRASKRPRRSTAARA